MSMRTYDEIVLGFSGDYILKCSLEDVKRLLIVCDEPEKYTFYLLERLAQKLPVKFYSLDNVFSENVSKEFEVVDVTELLPNILVFEELNYSISSRIIVEAFKYSLTLSEEEFLLLHSILVSLLKQNNKINLLQIVSSVKSFYGSESSILERNSSLKLDWRLHLIEELFPHIIKEDKGFVKENIFYNISTLNSLESKLLSLLLLLSKNLVENRDCFNVILLGDCPENFEVGLIKFLQFMQNLTWPIQAIIAYKSFSIKYLNFFRTFVANKSFLEKFKTFYNILYKEACIEGELFYIKNENIIQFFYDEPKIVYNISVEESGSTSSRDDFIEDHKLTQKILDVVVKYPNVTKQGLIQSLSIDYPSELVEYVLNELIEKGYIIVEIEKTKAGSFAKLSISMDGRALLSKKEVEGN